MDVRQPLATVAPPISVTCVKYSHRFTLPEPFPSWIRPLPPEPWPHRPCPPGLSCDWACLVVGEPEKLDGERLRPCSATPSRSSWREGEELSERWREEEELRGRGGGLKSIPLRSCISWVRLARKSASLVLLARTLSLRRLENRTKDTMIVIPSVRWFFLYNITKLAIYIIFFLYYLWSAFSSKSTFCNTLSCS